MHKILHKFTKTLKNRANNPHIASRMSYIDGEFIVHLEKTKPILLLPENLSGSGETGLAAV